MGLLKKYLIHLISLFYKKKLDDLLKEFISLTDFDLLDSELKKMGVRKKKWAGRVTTSKGARRVGHPPTT